MIKPIISAKKFLANEDAATMVEYGLLIALVAIAVAAAAFVLGRGTRRLFDTAAQSV
jgi:Flp pilus assembly pilin Flp